MVNARMDYCASISAFLLLFMGSIFAVVGLTGNWGSATLNVDGILSSRGDFTLWDIVVSSNVSIIGINLPDVKVNIDKTLCFGHLPLTEVEQVCGKFKVMRTFVVLSLRTVLLAFLCATVACTSAIVCSARRGITRVAMLVAAVFSELASVCALAAVVTALTLPRDNPYFAEICEPGAGSICTVLLVLLTSASTILELKCWCGSRRTDGTDDTATMVEGGRQIPRAHEEMC